MHGHQDQKNLIKLKINPNLSQVELHISHCWRYRCVPCRWSPDVALQTWLHRTSVWRGSRGWSYPPPRGESSWRSQGLQSKCLSFPKLPLDFLYQTYRLVVSTPLKNMCKSNWHGSYWDNEGLLSWSFATSFRMSLQFSASNNPQYSN